MEGDFAEQTQRDRCIKALLVDYMAHLVQYRALLVDYTALLVQCRAVFKDLLRRLCGADAARLQTQRDKCIMALLMDHMAHLAQCRALLRDLGRRLCGADAARQAHHGSFGRLCDLFGAL